MSHIWLKLELTLHPLLYRRKKKEMPFGPKTLIYKSTMLCNKCNTLKNLKKIKNKHIYFLSTICLPNYKLVF